MNYTFDLSDIYGSVRLMGLDYTTEKKGWHYPTHRHRFYELIYCEEGNWEQTIGECVYTLHKGEAILIKSDFPHSTTVLSTCSYLGFHFRLEDKEIHTILQSVANPLIASVEVAESMSRFIAAYGHYWTRGGGWSSDTERFRLEHAVEKMGMMSEIFMIITAAARYFLNREPIESDAEVLLKPGQIKMAHELSVVLESRINGKLQFEEIARELTYNRSYLTQCFKRVYGMSPKEYFMRLKIRRAKNLLQETDWPVERIGEMLSFSSPQHFSAAFRKIVQQSPLQFRKLS